MAKKLVSYKQLKEIEKILVKQSTEKSKLALSLLNEAFFCEETLTKLKKEVEEDGVTTTMCQGNYFITRENPALKGYNATLKSYQTLIKQILELLDDIPTEETDELKEFMNA